MLHVEILKANDAGILNIFDVRVSVTCLSDVLYDAGIAWSHIGAGVVAKEVAGDIGRILTLIGKRSLV